MRWLSITARFLMYDVKTICGLEYLIPQVKNIYLSAEGSGLMPNRL